MKLFHVSGTLEIDLVVLAETQEQAEASARENWWEEVKDADLVPDAFHVTEVQTPKQLKWMGEDNLKYCNPYGAEGLTYEDGCCSPQLSIDEYLANMEESKG